MNNKITINQLLNRIEKLEQTVFGEKILSTTATTVTNNNLQLTELMSVLLAEANKLKQFFSQNDTIIMQTIINEQPSKSSIQVTSFSTLYEEENDNDLAAICNVLSSKQRLVIIRILAKQDLSSGELMKAANMAGGHLHHHLKDLQNKGFVVKQDNGKYAATDFGLNAYLTVASLNRKQRYNINGATKL